MDLGFLRVQRVRVPLGQPVQLLVYAEDASTGMQVLGKVHLQNFDAHGRPLLEEFDTNSIHVTVLHKRMARYAWGERSCEVPSGFVRAPGYPDTSIDFEFDSPPRNCSE